MTKTIGVLSLQGCVQPHQLHIEALGAEFRPVKTARDFGAVDAFILPGGESTTMLKLIDAFHLWDVLQESFLQKPVWGICAGAILMAQTVLNPAQKSFGLLPVTIERNAYGRQLDSIQQDILDYPVTFIRAPRIGDVAADVQVLAMRDSVPVWVRRGMYMATSFHPELTPVYPSPMHRYFLDMVNSY